jgi:hypothetical protein
VLRVTESSSPFFVAVIGYVQTNTLTRYFLYENGTFKVICSKFGKPSAFKHQSQQGLILGVTGATVSQPAFIAQCE